MSDVGETPVFRFYQTDLCEPFTFHVNLFPQMLMILFKMSMLVISNLSVQIIGLLQLSLSFRQIVVKILFSLDKMLSET